MSSSARAQVRCHHSQGVELTDCLAPAASKASTSVSEKQQACSRFIEVNGISILGALGIFESVTSGNE